MKSNYVKLKSAEIEKLEKEVEILTVNNFSYQEHIKRKFPPKFDALFLCIQYLLLLYSSYHTQPTVV